MTGPYRFHLNDDPWSQYIRNEHDDSIIQRMNESLRNDDICEYQDESHSIDGEEVEL